MASTLPLTENDFPAIDARISYDEQRRIELFLKDQIPKKVAFVGYLIVAIHVHQPSYWNCYGMCDYTLCLLASLQGFHISRRARNKISDTLRSGLPQHGNTWGYIFFVGAILINMLRDAVRKKWAQYIPLPMAMEIPFYIGPYFAIYMCMGSLILFIWERLDKLKANAFASTVASSLICGDGIWTLPQSILALAKVKPPICMKFLSRKTNDKFDAFIVTLS
ncbi:putative metal-nicotianamine transporter YSL7 [Dendrobium catenatum]|uniref:Putative metal-nicotianamine transporter YSL7 n=1 Tax=Dendrobium catenatum TaxID=906689 RepID=A0A2I0WCF8_9ASPA|nr:putative metal-nicotianamine transporter YSL7 [Dendrobium catenatum]